MSQCAYDLTIYLLRYDHHRDRLQILERWLDGKASARLKVRGDYCHLFRASLEMKMPENLRPSGPTQTSDHFDVIVVGAGFAGIYALHRLIEAGFRVLAIEAGSGAGGTWHWNRYPGARCDVESIEYSFSFSDELQQEWDWSERYASQPEIERYANHVVDRFGLRDRFRFNTRIRTAAYQDRFSLWRIELEPNEFITTSFLVMATGSLSAVNVPDIPGCRDFAGQQYHTGLWPPHDVDFSGQRVGIIGTGSSGVQALPFIADMAEEVIVFQRTPTYTVPARNQAITPDELTSIKRDYPAFRRKQRKMPGAQGVNVKSPRVPALSVSPGERAILLRNGWEAGGWSFTSTFNDTLVNRQGNEYVSQFVRDMIQEIVTDQEVAQRLAPFQPIGCKRLCLDNGYYETYNRDNVRLINLPETPIRRVQSRGIALTDQDIDLDALIFATGFDAMTGSLLRIDISGRQGRRLGDVWAAGPTTYLGLGVPGFPNFFVLTGPGSPSVLCNMVTAAEQQVDWIADCLLYLTSTGRRSIEASVSSAAAWVEHVNAVAHSTLYPSCNSWYLGANIPGKPRVFMPLLGFPQYSEKCDEVADRGYEGFVLT